MSGAHKLNHAQVEKAVKALLKFVGDQDKHTLLDDDELLYLASVGQGAVCRLRCLPGAGRWAATAASKTGQLERRGCRAAHVAAPPCR